MKTNQGSKGGLILVDILLMVGLIACLVSTSIFEHRGDMRNNEIYSNLFTFKSIHSIISIVFIGIMALHIWQHWAFTKALFTKQSFIRNKLTTITILTFISLIISLVLYFAGGFTFFTTHFHSFVANLFTFAIIAHLLFKSKRLYLLVKGNQDKSERKTGQGA
jgi:hypothetical protein